MAMPRPMASYEPRPTLRLMVAHKMTLMTQHKPRPMAAH